MPYFNVGRQRIRYEDTGGSAPAVVFSHCFAMDGSMFAPQLTEVAKTHRCITWDQRAHGGSVTARPFTLWDSARDIVSLLDHLQIEQACFVGAGQGGFVSLRVALLAPKRVRSLLITGSSAAAETPSQKAAFEDLIGALLVSRRDGQPQVALEILARVCFGARFDGSAWKAKWRQWPTDQLLFAFRGLIERNDLSKHLRKIAAPTLVLHGTADQSYAPSLGRAIAARVRDSRGFIAVEGGAHFLCLTDPAPVNAALTGLLTDVERLVKVSVATPRNMLSRPALPRPSGA